MGVLGVILCEVLELEFAHLLQSDLAISRITTVADDTAERFVEVLASSGLPNLQRIARVEDFAADPTADLDVLVRVLELALHTRKKTLQRGLLDAAHEMSPCVDALFLGYGLCGNALEKPEELLAEAGVPIFIPMDEDHPVDDCVGMVIGGRDAYYGEQCKIAGTFFMTPGWTYHWKRIFDKEFGSISVDLAKRLFARYERSLLLSTPMMSEEEMRGNVEEFNRLFDCRTETREGTLQILNDAWEDAKRYVVDQPDRSA